LAGGLIDRLRNRQYPAIVLYLFLIAGAFLVGVVIFDLVIMPGIVGRGSVAIAPAIEGMSLKQAQEVCRKERLEVAVAGNRSSDEIPEGYVISQDPGQGKGLKRGRTIKVVLSSGRRMEIVPSFVGKTIREAEVLVESSGLARGRTVRVLVPGEGQPSVLATSPAAGAKVPRGAPVDILVAIPGEPKSYLMPDLVGRDYPFVKDRLEKLGFNVVHAASRKRGEGRFPNAILSQTPPAGAKIKEGDTIELVVSALE
jgi:beta-lactam-binding protein with PASTA domain